MGSLPVAAFSPSCSPGRGREKRFRSQALAGSEPSPTSDPLLELSGAASRAAGLLLERFLFHICSGELWGNKCTQTSSSGDLPWRSLALRTALMSAKICSAFGGRESPGIVNHMEKLFLCQVLRIRTRNGANVVISGVINPRHNGAFSS